MVSLANPFFYPIEFSLILPHPQDEVTGKIHQFIGTSLPTAPSKRFISSFHGQALTCSCITPTDLYTSNKKGTIVRYSLRDFKVVGKPFGQDASRFATDDAGKTSKGKGKASTVQAVGGHKGEILCLTASEDGRYLLSGGRDKMIGVWEIGGKGVEEGSVRWLKALGGHKDAVTVSLREPGGRRDSPLSSSSCNATSPHSRSLFHPCPIHRIISFPRLYPVI